MFHKSIESLIKYPAPYSILRTYSNVIRSIQIYLFMLISSFNNGEIKPFLNIILLVCFLLDDKVKVGFKNSFSKFIKFFIVKFINKLNVIIIENITVVKIEIGNHVNKMNIKNNEGKYFRNPNVFRNEFINSFC